MLACKRFLIWQYYDKHPNLEVSTSHVGTMNVEHFYPSMLSHTTRFVALLLRLLRCACCSCTCGRSSCRSGLSRLLLLLLLQAHVLLVPLCLLVLLCVLLDVTVLLQCAQLPQARLSEGSWGASPTTMCHCSCHCSGVVVNASAVVGDRSCCTCLCHHSHCCLCHVLPGRATN